MRLTIRVVSIALVTALAALGATAKPAEVKLLIRARDANRKIPPEVASAARTLAEYPAQKAIVVPRVAQERLTIALSHAGFFVTELEDHIDTPRAHIRTDDGPSAGVPISDGLFVLQTVAPITEAWQAASDQIGIVAVSPLPERAVIISATVNQVSELAKLPWVQYVTPYAPSFKLAPTGMSPVNVYTVQVADTELAKPAIAEIRARVGGFLLEYTYGHCLTARFKATLPVAQELLTNPFVVGVSSYVPPEASDERQGLSLARLAPNENTAGAHPRYLDWLATNFGITPTVITQSGVIVDVADTGLDRACKPGAFHQDLIGRNMYHVGVAGPTGYFNDREYHGTMVASVIGGNPSYGVDTQNRPTPANGMLDSAGLYYGLGIAPGLRIGSTTMESQGVAGMSIPTMTGHAVSSSCVNRLAATPCTYTSTPCRALVQNYSSNSYSVANAGAYTEESAAFDVAVRNAGNNTGLPLSITMSAGNYKQTVGDLTTAVMAPATAKNVITVGATESVRPAVPACDAQTDGVSRHKAVSYDAVAWLSRRGTSDGRIKPDLVAPGTLVTGARATAPSEIHPMVACMDVNPTDATAVRYAGSSGTSFSAPVAAGAIALMQIVDPSWTPSPAMFKAKLIASAQSLTGFTDGQTQQKVVKWPSAAQGFGKIDLARALRPKYRAGGYPSGNRDQSILLGQGQTSQSTVVAQDTALTMAEGIRIVLVWTDPPGTPSSAKALVNDLDLTVEATYGSKVYYGNVLDSDGWSLPNSSLPRDSVNNVEVVTIKPDTMWYQFGPLWALNSFRITVSATSLNGKALPGSYNNQDFALFVVNAMDEILYQ